MNEFLLLIPAFLLILILKNKKNVLALVPLVFYALGAIVGYVMTFNPVYPSSVNNGHQMPSITANVFLIICLFISFRPIIKSTVNDIRAFDINMDNLYAFSYFLMVISIFYVIWMAPHVTEGINAIGDITEYKNSVSEEGMTFAKQSPLVGWLLSIQVALRPIIVFLFCLSLCNKRTAGFYRLMMAIIALIPPVVQVMATAYRNELVFTGVNFFICYLFFRNHYTKKTRRTFIYSILGLFSSLVLFLIVFIAVLRFGEGGNDYVLFSLERYMGEPFLNFNTMLWGEDTLLWGNKSFVVIRKYLGLSFIDPRQIKDYDYMLGYQYNYFYSFIGNFYMDFGWGGAIITCSLFTLLVRTVQKSFARRNLSMSLNVFNYIYITIILRSYFYFVYTGYNFFSLIFLILGFLFCHYYIFNRVRTRRRI